MVYQALTGSKSEEKVPTNPKHCIKVCITQANNNYGIGMCTISSKLEALCDQ